MTNQRPPLLDLQSLTDLDGLSDKEFKFVVDADLRRNSPGANFPPRLSKALRTTHLHRWYSMLRRTQVNTANQLEVRALDHEADMMDLEDERIVDADVVRLAQLDTAIRTKEREFLRAQAGTKRFQGTLDQAVLEAEYLISQQDPTFTSTPTVSTDETHAGGLD